MYHIWYTDAACMKPKSRDSSEGQADLFRKQGKKVPAIFYRTEAGGEPVRESAIKNDSNERKENSQKDGPQRVNLR